MRRSVVWMLAPAILTIGLLFAGGLLLCLRESVSTADGWTLQHYAALLGDREFLAALGLTIAVSLATTVLSAVCGLSLALALHPVVQRSRSITVLLQIPIAVPHLAMALVLINVLAPSGLLARIAYTAGWIAGPADFPQLLNDGQGLGIILAYVLKETPFIALMVLSTLVRTEREYDDVARTLGASPWQRLRWVTIPLAAPALLSSSVIVLAFVFNAFEIPFLLGRPYPAMLSVVAQRRFADVDLAQRPGAMAIALVMLAVTVALAAIYSKVASAVTGAERPSLP